MHSSRIATAAIAAMIVLAAPTTIAAECFKLTPAADRVFRQNSTPKERLAARRAGKRDGHCTTIVPEATAGSIDEAMAMALLPELRARLAIAKSATVNATKVNAGKRDRAKRTAKSRVERHQGPRARPSSAPAARPVDTAKDLERAPVGAPIVVPPILGPAIVPAEPAAIVPAPIDAGRRMPAGPVQPSADRCELRTGWRRALCRLW